MENKKLIQNLYLCILISFLLLLLGSCKEYEEPDEIYKPGETTNVDGAVITGIEPAGGAVAGVRVITLLGHNFTAGDTTWIFVGNISSPRIKSLTDTKIELYRPMISGQIEIKVVIPSAADKISGIASYNIEAPIDSVQSFLVGSGLPNFTTMEIRKDGTFWTAGNRRIDTVSADGLFFGNFKDRSRGLPSAFSSVTDLKFGRGGSLFVLVGRADVYMISTRTADSLKPPQVYANISSGTARKFDFDQQGNLYVGAANGLNVVSPLTDSTGSVTPANQYTGITFEEIRVFNNYVYVADSKNLWRSAISGTSVGAPELLLNIDTSGLDTCTISSFNLDTDGRIFICLQNAEYSLYIIEDDGTFAPFYVDNIIPTEVGQILWGYNSRYLYLYRRGIQSGIRLFILGTEKNGAPYYGRDL